MLRVGCLLEEVSSVGFKALSKLLFLRKFTFDDESFNGTKRRLKHLLLCTQFLPQLAIAGKMDITRRFQFLDYKEFKDCEGYHDQVVQQPFQLRLEEVILERQVYPHPNCQLPQLRRVFWTQPIGDVLVFFNQFKTITELGFDSADGTLVEKVVQEVGARLSKLVLEEITFSLPQVLMHCPNLEYLRLECCSCPDFIGSWPSNMFSCLKEVDIDMNDHPHSNKVPEGFIKEVNLKKI